MGVSERVGAPQEEIKAGQGMDSWGGICGKVGNDGIGNTDAVMNYEKEKNATQGIHPGGYKLGFRGTACSMVSVSL